MSDPLFSSFEKAQIETFKRESYSAVWDDWYLRFARKVMDFSVRRMAEENRRLKAKLEEETLARRQAEVDVEDLRDQRQRMGVAIDHALRGTLYPEHFGMQSRFEAIQKLAVSRPPIVVSNDSLCP